MDPVSTSKIAVTVGKFVGAVLSECAPVLEGIMTRAFLKAFTDRAVIAKRNPELDGLWDEARDPKGKPDGRNS